MANKQNRNYPVANNAENEQVEQQEATRPVKSLKGEVNCAKLRIRTAPNTNADVISIVEEGTKLSVQRIDEEGWFRVKSGNTVGFAMSEFINI